MPTWTEVRRAVEDLNEWTDFWFYSQALLTGQEGTEQALKGMNSCLTVIESAALAEFQQQLLVTSALETCLDGGLAPELTTRVRRAYELFHEVNALPLPTPTVAPPAAECEEEHNWFGG
jgi:hypothetical protein